jgi:hypothetical protein
MKMPLRLLAFSALGLLGFAAPARSQTVILGGPGAFPVRTMYVPTTNYVTTSNIVNSPIGPTAYVQAPQPMYVQPTSYVTTTTYLPRRAFVPTTTYVPRSAYVVDPGLTPVGYEVIRPLRRTRVVYPRRVVNYVY